MRVKYVLRRIRKLDYKTMFSKVNALHKKTGKSRLYLLRDIKKCATKYGAGYSDYDLYEMYNLTDEQRDTYITRGRNNEIVREHNDKAYIHYFNSKIEFNQIFEKYLKRDWCPLQAGNQDQVLDFLRSHENIVAKPENGQCGKGVEKINVTEAGGPEAVYDSLKDNGTDYVLEDLIIQDPAVAAIYPYAINTVRIVTLLKDNVPHIICAYFRIGNGGRHVDNFNSGGMASPVDEKTGIVKDKAIDKKKTLYETHPMTGTKIEGFQFPHWEEALELCKEAALEIPQVGYVGWDVAFSNKGPLLVEGNNFPGHDIYQLPEHTHDGLGIYPKFNI